MKPTVTTDQVKRFHADGVVFLEGFFPQEYIDSLTKGIQKNLEDLILKDVYQITGCSLEKSKRLDLFMGY